MRHQIIRREERKSGKVDNVVSLPKARQNTGTLHRWIDLSTRRENFWKASMYTIMLLVVAVSFYFYHRAEQTKHRMKLEKPQSDINGYRYYVPRERSQQNMN